MSFRNLSWQDRINYLYNNSDLDESSLEILKHYGDDDYSLINENYVTNYQLPEGIAVNIKINNKEYFIPMVTEEPSVIAALSYAGKMAINGTQAFIDDNLVRGQIVYSLQANLNFDDVKNYIKNNETELLNKANEAYPTILNHHGGAKKLIVRNIDNTFISIDLFVDTGDAMGANIVNTMLEGLAKYLNKKFSLTSLIDILTNDGTSHLVTVTANIPVENLSKSFNFDEGLRIAKIIENLSSLAQLDVSRAVTHNKGIMNGVDALVVATGNDWRAVEAGAHAYACNDGKYKGLSIWQVKDNNLFGKLTLPLHLGIVGGSIKSLPIAKVNNNLLSIQTSRELNEIVASVGLLQNLAALRALGTEGIQKGHMHLQYRNYALSVGAKLDEVQRVVDELSICKHASVTEAKKILQKMHNKKA